MTTATTDDRRQRLLDQAFERLPRDQNRRERLLSQVFDQPETEPEDPISIFGLAARMAREVEFRQPDPDRSLLGELGVGVVRGFAGGVEAGGGLARLTAGQLERLVGTNALSRYLDIFGEFQVAQAAFTRARFPRSQEPGFTARRTIGDVGEALPSLAMQVGTGLAGRPLGALAQVGAFATTGAGQVAGQQYVAALAATKDPNKAAAEAAGAGLITLGLNSIPGFAAFRKFPGSQRFFMDAAIKVGGRMALVGVTESFEEMAEAVLIDTYASIIRDDPALARRIFDGDPEYWSDVLRQGLAGFFAGNLAGVALGGVELSQRQQLIGQITEIIESTGALRSAQFATAQRFMARVRDAQRVRDVAAQARKAFAGAIIGDEFSEGGRRVRVVSVAADQLTYETESGDTVTMPKTEFGRRFDLVLATESQLARRLAAQPEQHTRSRVRGVQSAVEKGNVTTAQDEERQLLNELTRIRQEVESGGRAVDDAKGEVIRLAREQIKGPSVPKPVLTQLGQARTQAGLRRGMFQVRKAVAAQRRRKAIEAAQKAVTDAAKSKGFRNEILRGLRSVGRGFRQARLSTAGQRSLATLLKRLENAPPETLEAELRDSLEALNTVTTATTDEIRQIASAIETQAKIATGRGALAVKRRRARLRRLSSAIADEMAQNVDPRPTRRGRILANAQGPISGLLRLTFGLIESMDLDTLSEFLGGKNSTTWKALFRSIELGQRDGLGGYYESMDRLSEFMAQLGIDFGSEELTRLSAELTGQANTLGALMSAIGIETSQRLEAPTRRVLTEAGEEIDLTGAEIMGLAAATSDEETRQMITEKETPVRFSREPVGKSRRITQTDLDSILAQLAPSEQAIVDFMVAEMNGPVKEVMRAWSVQHLGFDITKPEMWWTRHRRVEGKEEEPTTLSNLRAQYLRTVGMRPGITRARGQDVKSPIEVRDIFVDFNSVVWQTNMVAHLMPAMQDARLILRSKAVREVLNNSRAARAQGAFDTIFDQISREITGVPATRGLTERLLDPIIRRLPRGLLGLNPRVAAYQVVSAVMAQSEVPAQFLLESVGAAFDSEVEDRMRKNPIMRMRMESSVMGLVNESSDLGRSMLGFKGRGEGPMILIRIMDKAAVRIVWRAAELQAESEGLKGQALRTRTWEIGERAIARTQPMFDSVHIAERAVEARVSGGFFRLASFFRAQRNKLVSMVIRSARRIQKSSDQRTIQKEVVNIAITTIGNAIAIASIRNLLTVGSIAALLTADFPEREEQDDFMRGFAADLIRTLGGIPFLGDWIAEIVVQLLLPAERAFEAEFSPLGGMLTEGARGVGRMRRGLDDDEVLKMLDGATSIFASAASIVGIPAVPVVREFRKIIAELKKKDSGIGSTPP